MDFSEHHLRILSWTADGVSAAAIVGAISGILPPLAALGGVIWYAIQIWESKTVQKHVRRLRARRRAIRLAVLEATRRELLKDQE